MAAGSAWQQPGRGVHHSDDNIVIGSRKNGTQLERKRKNDGEDSEGVSKKPKKR